MKNTTVRFLDMGNAEYKHTWDRQAGLLNEIVAIKKANAGFDGAAAAPTPNHLLFVEHPHVYTLGKHGDEHNLLLNYIQLQAKDAAFFRTDRGGDITYHGPGQIVGYPILDLENFGIGLRQYIHNIEETIIRVVADFGLTGMRDPHATGVWLDTGTSAARKICAIGVRSTRYVTMHGFAFNVNTDLTYFNHINPCGFTDRGVTSLARELGAPQDFESVKSRVRSHFEAVFGATIIE